MKSNRGAPYTVFSCDACGPYSLPNDLVEEIATGTVAVPDPQVFRAWLINQPVRESLKQEGPLIRANTFRKIRRGLN